MKIIYALFFVFILNNIIYAQDITCNFIVDNDEFNKIANGKIYKNKETSGTVCRYENNNVISYMNIVNGVPHGKSEIFYPNGVLNSKGVFRNGLIDGLLEINYPNGNKQILANYKNGVLKGTSKVYYENGQIKEQCNNDNNSSRICSIYDENKMLKIKYKISNNKEEYTKIFNYYDNGIVKEILQYQNNKLNGISYSYYPNKKIEREISFKNDIQDGIAKVYYENGSLRQETTYQKGKIEGLNKSYYKNGKVQVEGNFKNNKADGPAKFYYENGKLNFTLINKKGKPISGKCSNGREISKKELKEFMNGIEIQCE